MCVYVCVCIECACARAHECMHAYLFMCACVRVCKMHALA